MCPNCAFAGLLKCRQNLSQWFKWWAIDNVRIK